MEENTSYSDMTRKEFLGGAAAFVAMPPLSACADDGQSVAPAFVSTRRSEKRQEMLIQEWDTATGLVSKEVYWAYMGDGDTRGFKALDDLESAFDKVMREATGTVVSGDAPAVWSVYNMGYIVKTRKSLFSIDLNHRRGREFAPLLDFALVTHMHGDHWRRDFCRAMDEAGKTVVSNFLENKGASACGYAAGEREIVLGDVEIRTFRVDHAREAWGIDFTTAFEMRIGNYRLLHTGDCAPSNDKLCVKWGCPDLWLLMPMRALDVADAVRRINPKTCVFGHLWELGHVVGHGRIHKAHIDRAMPMAKSHCKDASVAFWGDRVV